MTFNKTIFFVLIGLCIMLSACSAASSTPDRPVVIATTTLIGDVVRQVGGDLIELHVLLPVNSDPHSFSAAPKDVAMIEAAQLVFLNGLNLEESLTDLVTANARGKVVPVSSGISTILLGEDHHSEGEDHDPDGSQAAPDPHVWMDPANVQIWTETIARELSALDPEHASVFKQNAEQYQTELELLDEWIRAQIEQIPPEQRVLVTDHDTLGYFANSFGFQVIGVVVPGGSTLSDPSAQQIAALEKTISAFDTPAIFVDATVNPQVSERIAADTGTSLVKLYTGSLSEPDGPAGTYLDLMRYTVTSIVQALK